MPPPSCDREPSELTDVLLELALGESPEAAVAATYGLLADGWPLLGIAHGVVAAQREVGVRWSRNELTVADEHAATAVSDTVLAVLEQQLTRHVTGSAESIVVVCPEGEWHVLAARIVALQLRGRGLRARTLGGSLPAGHLQRYAQHRRIDAIALTCSTALALPGASAAIDAAAELGLPVLVGGRAFGADAARAGALGATSWAADAADAPTLLPSAPAEGRRRRLGAYHRRSLRRRDLVHSAMTELARRWRPFARYTEWQVQHTRQDIDYIVSHADVSLLVDDARLMDDFLEWLVEVLAARGVSLDAVEVALDVLAAGADEEFTDLLRSSAARCFAGGGPTSPGSQT